MAPFSPQTLYEHDFFLWTQEQATLLRKGTVVDLDWSNLAEEIESLGKSEQREVYHRLTRLLEHLLKLHLAACLLPQDMIRAGRGWRNTVKVQRLEVTKVLRANPSLRATVPLEIAEAYAVARLEVDTALAIEEHMIPAVCPWTVEQVLDHEFFPEA